jgi:hypothetical protein
MARRTGTDRDLLAMALVGCEGEKARIDAAIREIQAQLGHRGPGRPKAATDGAAPKKRSIMSAAGRKRIAAAQRKRWAALKESQARGKSAKAAAPKKRKLSAAGRRAIIAATRKRWAAVRKAAARKTKPVAKAAPKAQVQKAAAATA